MPKCSSAESSSVCLSASKNVSKPIFKPAQLFKSTKKDLLGHEFLINIPTLLNEYYVCFTNKTKPDSKLHTQKAHVHAFCKDLIAKCII